MTGHRIHALVVLELEFDVEGEGWRPSRMAQEVQELTEGEGTGSKAVTVKSRKVLHMALDNFDLAESQAADRMEQLAAAVQEGLDP